MPRCHLIFDADDTLWENNVYFEEVFDQFCDYLAHSSMAPAEIRAVLDEIERVNAKINGYGSRNFARNLAACYQHLAEKQISEADTNAIIELAHAIMAKPVQLIDGVAETLSQLSGRHDLLLFTKGDPQEQQDKIERSGLSAFFAHTAIVKEKDETAYRRLAHQRECCPERTWMIGNSPKSDINPALAAGLNAVFVPHARTWTLEREEVPSDHPRLLRVETIRELTEHF